MTPFMVLDGVTSFLSLIDAGFPRALENLENHKKSSMHGKIMEFEKKPEKSGKNQGIL